MILKNKRYKKIIDKNKETELYNERLQKIKEEIMEIKNKFIYNKK